MVRGRNSCRCPHVYICSCMLYHDEVIPLTCPYTNESRVLSFTKHVTLYLERDSSIRIGIGGTEEDSKAGGNGESEREAMDEIQVIMISITVL